MKNYLEAVLSKVSPEASANLIKDEENKLKVERVARIVEQSRFFQFMKDFTSDIDLIKKVITAPKNLKELDDIINKIEDDGLRSSLKVIYRLDEAADDYNKTRRKLGISEMDFSARPTEKPPSKNRLTESKD